MANELPGDAPLPIRERIKEFPTSPGVYLMRDKKGEVVYVGKAANLRSRLRSYFTLRADDRFFVRLLDHVLSDIEVVVTRNATEALLVEDQLIKTHQPRFNVKLKDDKNFLNIRLDTSHAYPRLEVVRRRRKDGARYFGPYASATSIRQTLRLVNRHFRLRTCTDSQLQNRSRPCLEYQIQRCPAPCVLDVPADDYAASVRQVQLFLEGRGDQLAKELRERMEGAATDMDFERAAHFRDQARAVERSLERQDVVLKGLVDLDVLGLAREGPHVAVHLQHVRHGRVCGAEAYKLGQNEAPDDVILGQFVDRYYSRAQSFPPEILLQTEIEDADFYAEWLSECRATGRVRLRVPKRGERRRLVDGAVRNARSTLRLDQDRASRAREVLIELQRRLRLRRFPERIECFDISNIQGTDPVASMVVFVDGEPDRGEYRRFHIRGQDTPDDFAMMREALSRRLRRSQAGDWEAPDLIVIDGGKGQLAIVQAVLAELGTPDVELVSLAKSRVLAGDADDDPARSAERVFVPGVRDPIVLRQNSAPLYLLTRLRDEAHRFAITFHRQTRRKQRLASALDEIPGVGPSRRKALLRHFGSLSAVKAASAAELCEVSGISQALAERIADTLSTD